MSHQRLIEGDPRARARTGSRRSGPGCTCSRPGRRWRRSGDGQVRAGGRWRPCRRPVGGADARQVRDRAGDRVDDHERNAFLTYLTQLRHGQLGEHQDTPSVSWLASALVQLAGRALPCRTAETARPCCGRRNVLDAAQDLHRPRAVYAVEDEVDQAGPAAASLTGRWYCACRAAASTRALVSGATSGRPLTTLETVGRDTPASAAMAASVGRRRTRFAVGAGAVPCRLGARHVPTTPSLMASLRPRCCPAADSPKPSAGGMDSSPGLRD